MRTLLVVGLMACAPEPEVMELTGPGFDGGELIEAREAGYVVGLTELHVKNAPGPGGRFGELTEAVVDQMFPPDGELGEVPGWVGTSFRNIGVLHWWTMTVWEDRDAMLAFVVSAPHVAAMTEIGDVAAAATSLHLEVEADALPDWDEALALLAAETPIDLER
jgi:hypothetical protein